SDANGTPTNPREYALPGNQESDFPWPNSVVMMAGVAAATTRLRVVGAAVLAPLRHPLLLAKELATLDQLAEGRLVILPSVSWHEAEYDALGVPFRRRGAILDEQLEIMNAVWRESPVSYHGEHFDFDNVYLEPKAHRPEGVTMWFGGSTVHDKVVERLTRFGSGVMGLGPVKPDDLARLAEALDAAGRSIDEMELVSGIGGRFTGADDIARLDDALPRLSQRIEAGFTTFSIKPCQFIDDADDLPGFLDEVVEKAGEIAAGVA
ncbi:MAG: LLM class flavin-dependent oxidoreductase, partial [Ilumatobacter sp.]